jgi:hypothetical protein
VQPATVLSWGSAGESWRPRPPSRSSAAGGLRTEHPIDLVQLVHSGGVIGLRGHGPHDRPHEVSLGALGAIEGKFPMKRTRHLCQAAPGNAFVRQIAYVPSGHLVINVVEATRGQQVRHQRSTTPSVRGLPGNLPSDAALYQGHQKGRRDVASAKRPAPIRARRAAGGWRARLIEEEASLGKMLGPAPFPVVPRASLNSVRQRGGGPHGAYRR